MSNLINCPDCGREVSKRAPTCPGCGCPIVVELTPSINEPIQASPQPTSPPPPLQTASQPLPIQIPIIVSICAGVAIWALSPVVTGELEPWDSGSFYLPIAIALTSLLLGFLYPRSFAVSAFGLTLGQMLYMGLFLPTGPLVAIGFLMLAGCGVVLSLPFAFIASLTKRRPQWLKSNYTKQQEAEQGAPSNGDNAPL